MKNKKMVYCALMAAVLCVISPLSIPVGAVPISLATLGVMLAGALLGAQLGTLSVLIYLVLGWVGLPVFAGYSSGFACLFGPTGGYMIGYLFLAFLTGFLYKKKTLPYLVGSILVGELVLYLLGTVWFMFVAQTSLVSALTICVLPFIPGDIAKIVLVCLLLPQLEKVVHFD